MNQVIEYISNCSDVSELYDILNIVNNRIKETEKSDGLLLFKDIINTKLLEYFPEVSIEINEYKRVEEEYENDYLYVKFTCSLLYEQIDYEKTIVFDFYIQNRRGGIKAEYENLNIQIISGFNEIINKKINNNFISTEMVHSIETDEKTWEIINEILYICRDIIY